MVATQQLDLATALRVQSMFPVNIALVYLSEDNVVPEAFVTDLRSGVSRYDCVAPVNCERVCEVLEDGFSGGLYRNEVCRATRGGPCTRGRGR